MAYEIEDINWDEMPAGAVEFSLEDEDYFLTWYDGNGNYWNYRGSMVRPSHKYDDGRKRYKVRDVETIDMGNDFSLAVLKENGEIIEVCIEYKDVCVGVELTLEAAKERINSTTPEHIIYLDRLVDDFKSAYQPYLPLGAKHDHDI